MYRLINGPTLKGKFYGICQGHVFHLSFYVKIALATYRVCCKVLRQTGANANCK
jgi:hypothetical protein